MLVNKSSGTYYTIEDIHDMTPFFITLASASDTWMFLSSNGALTAGRKNAAGCIFPYETEDRLHAATSTGPKTLVRLGDGRVWEPFNKGFDNPYAVTRNLFKRITGDAIIYEEINSTLGMVFSYRWETSERYGIVRTSEIVNNSPEPITISILDGVENIVPHDVAPNLALESSCLTDAYKASERLGDRMAVYSLTSLIVDLPEPVEVLKANVAWYIGEADGILLSSKQIASFTEGRTPKAEDRVVGQKGAFMVHKNLDLALGKQESWVIVLDAKMNQKQISLLAQEIGQAGCGAMRSRVEADIKKSTDEIERIVAVADGMQLTADRNGCIRHYMNVLNNNMRGGVFLDGYSFEPQLFEDFVKTRNVCLYERNREFFKKAGCLENVIELHRLAFKTGEPDIIRMSMEFLPLTFSRRHGDPSRPWNSFNIHVKDEYGNRVYGYEGNWRDIFQNWEAMSLSYPNYIAPIIVKFLNASTADGYNPYRINQDGIDWEIPEPEDPFSGYGYWGDHQIVYLTRLLEWLEAYAPDDLAKLISYDAFTYADVPYEIKPYAQILKNSKDTINFVKSKHIEATRRAQMLGTDGKLLRVCNSDSSSRDTSGSVAKSGCNTTSDCNITSGCKDDLNVYHASFFEKLLVPILAKLSNLVPGGGIWMNTHRPEWNDGNNAIVGNGLSMVTVYQLYRHLICCRRLMDSLKDNADVSMSIEVSKWFNDIYNALKDMPNLTPRGYLDLAGMAFESYRETLYRNGLTGKTSVDIKSIDGFLALATQIIEETIKANKREDGMYHSYNILTLSEDSLSVSPLFLMLEGQTAMLGSGLLDTDDALKLIDAMENSGLMSDEHNAFFLYPMKQLKTFMERNIIPPERAVSSTLINKLITDGNETLVLRDADGNVRFSSNIRQHSDVTAALGVLEKNKQYREMVTGEAANIEVIYEEVFKHKQFTGRSGIMYKYEGIGSIYWHQNSKFQLSLQETITNAAGREQTQSGASLQAPEQNRQLIDAYYRLRSGFGFNKDAKKWGAFPLEPYSHCPYGMPAQQPGMTGQVKEDILTRMAELGITVKKGVLGFNPYLLRRSEFLAAPGVLRYVTAGGEFSAIDVDKDSLSFTVCCVPVVYHISAGNAVKVFDNRSVCCYSADSLSLNEDISRRIFNRDGNIGRIEVEISECV